MKRTAALFCALTLAFGLLSGCATSASGGNAALLPTVTPTPTPSAPTESVSPTPSPTETPADEERGPALLTDFSSTDLDGGEVDESLITGKTLTMVNVWATYCSPCLREMPDLGALHAELADRGFQVVGLVSDVLNQDGTLSQEQLDLAKEIVVETTADYPHMIPSEDLYGILAQVTAVPLTFFVDSEGYQVGYAYAGAKDKADWLAIIEPLLEEVGA